MDAAIPQIERPDGTMVDFEASLWVYQIRKEHAELFNMYIDRDHTIKELLKENASHKAIIQELQDKAFEKEKAYTGLTESLAGFHRDFVVHRDRLTAFEKEINETRKRCGQSAQSIISTPSCSKPKANSRRPFIPQSKSSAPTHREKHRIGEPHAPISSAPESIPTQLITTEYNESAREALRIASINHIPTQETPSKKCNNTIHSTLQPRLHSGLASPGAKQSSSKIDAGPIVPSKSGIQQNGRTLNQFALDIDEFAKGLPAKKNSLVVCHFLMGLDDKTLKHKTMDVLSRKDPTRFSKKQNGKHLIFFSWPEVRSLLEEMGELAPIGENEELL